MSGISTSAARIESTTIALVINRAHSESVGRTGVYSVGALITELGWIFREQATSDYGIDAHVETRDPLGNATGRLLALQIKSGQSWFSDTENGGVLYRGKLEHLAYWTKHSLPVILILFDPTERTCIWQHVSPPNIQRTPGGWRLYVPLSNRLDHRSLEIWRTLCKPGSGSPLFSEAQQLEFVTLAARDSVLLQAILEQTSELDQSLEQKLCSLALQTTSSALCRHALNVLSSRAHTALALNADLIIQLRDNKNRNLRVEVARAMGLLPRERVESHLRKLLEDRERVVRRAALASLVKATGDDAKHDILIYLKDPAPLVRVEACELAGILNASDLVDSLLERKADSSRRVRLSALKALTLIDRDLALRNANRFNVDEDLEEIQESLNISEAELEMYDLEEDHDASEFALKPETATLFSEFLGEFADYWLEESSWDIDCLRGFAVGYLVPHLGVEQVRKNVKAIYAKIDDEGYECRLLVGGLLLREAEVPEQDCLDVAYRLTLEILKEGNDIVGQAILLGMIAEPSVFRHLINIAELTLLRTAGRELDTAFTILAEMFGPDPDSLTWPTYGEYSGGEDENGVEDPDFDAVSFDPSLPEVASLLREGLRRWSMLRATPRVLGFLLAAESSQAWFKIPAVEKLESFSKDLIADYIGLGSAKQVVAAIYKRYCEGSESSGGSLK
jgi:hypothetical protein